MLSLRNLKSARNYPFSGIHSKRLLLSILPILILTAAIACLSYSYLSAPHAQAQTSTDHTEANEADHYIYAAAYSTTDGVKSTLVLNNAFNRELAARITLYNRQGEALPIPVISLPPIQISTFDIANWLAASNAEKFSEGSLEIFFHGPGMGIGGQLVITDERHGTSFDVPFTEDIEFSSSRLDGLWWSLDDKTQAEIFLANTKSSQIIVTPNFYIDGRGIESEPIVLEAHESKTLDIGQALRKLRAKQEAAGGVSLRHNGQPGSLAVTGVVTNKARGFSSTLRFIDATMQRSTNLHGAHLLIGQPDRLSGLPTKSKFTPRAIVRNNTDLPVEVNATVRYKLDNNASSVHPPPLTLNAFEVRELDMSDVINSVGSRTITDAGIELEHSGKPGCIVAAAASIDQSGNQVFDVPVKDPMAKKMAGGSHPWRIGGDERAVLHLKNIDPQGETSLRQAVVVLYYEGGNYTLPVQQVEAGQTFEVDIKKLRDEQIPDGFGNLIPAEVDRGQVRWFGRGELGQFIGRLVQYNPVVATSSSFSCPIPCPCEPSFDHGEIEGGPIQGTPGERFFVNLVDVAKDCNGFTYRYPVQDAGANITSSSPLTASVSGPVSDPFGGLSWQVTLGNQPGTATIRGSWTAVKWRSTCLGFSFGSNCSEFRCDFSYAVASASTTATVNQVQVTFQQGDGSALPSPLRVGISATALDNTVHDRKQRLRAVVQPSSEAANITILVSSKLQATIVSRSGGVITFDVVGTTKSTTRGDSSITARNAQSGATVATATVSVVVPAQVATPHDTIGGGIVVSNRVLDATTSPAIIRLPPNQVELSTIYVRFLTITVKDQFGDLIGDLYQGAEVSEADLGQLFSINQPLTAMSTYSDPVGTREVCCVVARGSAQANAWPSQPNIPLSQSGSAPQNIDVFVDGFRLTPGIANRQVSVSPPRNVTITWP